MPATEPSSSTPTPGRRPRVLVVVGAIGVVLYGLAQVLARVAIFIEGSTGLLPEPPDPWALVHAAASEFLISACLLSVASGLLRRDWARRSMTVALCCALPLLAEGCWYTWQGLSFGWGSVLAATEIVPHQPLLVFVPLAIPLALLLPTSMVWLLQRGRLRSELWLRLSIALSWALLGFFLLVVALDLRLGYELRWAEELAQQSIAEFLWNYRYRLFFAALGPVLVGSVVALFFPLLASRRKGAT